MINIIGKYGRANKALETRNAHLHLYDKKERKNRKLGHITITADSYEELQNSIDSLSDYLP
jgi:5-(carboxyamino)imidazole ribonucleotide synthase